jgi:DNA repair photolyase
MEERTGGARALRHRGAAANPPNRFEPIRAEADPDFEALRRTDPDGERPPDPRTRYAVDPSRSVLVRNDSPDVPFDVSLNPYRGCEHGCSYCYARPSHEYLGLSAGLDFETRILVKEDAPALLRRALMAPSWRPRVVALSGVTDAYQPVERRLRLTRRCLEVFAEFRNPVAVVTKSALVTRDADLLRDLAGFDAACVHVSITTLDTSLARAMEPRAAPPHRRLATVASLAEAGVPVGVMVAPVIPGLTDHEIPKIVEAAARAGATCVRYIVLRLPHGVADLFDAWLQRAAPGRRDRVLARLRDIRGGRLSDPRFHSRMRGEGIFAEQIDALFDLARRRSGLPADGPQLSAAAFRRPGGSQLSLFAHP